MRLIIREKHQPRGGAFAKRSTMENTEMRTSEIQPLPLRVVFRTLIFSFILYILVHETIFTLEISEILANNRVAHEPQDVGCKGRGSNQGVDTDSIKEGDSSVHLVPGSKSIAKEVLRSQQITPEIIYGKKLDTDIIKEGDSSAHLMPSTETTAKEVLQSQQITPEIIYGKKLDTDSIKEGDSSAHLMPSTETTAKTVVQSQQITPETIDEKKGENLDEKEGSRGNGPSRPKAEKESGVASPSKEIKSHGSSAFCLLLKDDNDILSEWVAYHYHVFRMRRLIVALDPDSKTSPYEVLKPFAHQSSYKGQFHLDFTIWNDEDYTPDFFHGEGKDYSKIPISNVREINFTDFKFDKRDHITSAFFNNVTISSTFLHKNETYNMDHQDEVKSAYLKVNNHRFRQRNFVSECYRQIKKERDIRETRMRKGQQVDVNTGIVSWTIHSDSDEFLVPNPWISSYIASSNGTSEQEQVDHRYYSQFVNFTGYSPKELETMYPKQPSRNSLWDFFQDYRKKEGSNLGECLFIPRLTYGSKEEGNSAYTKAYFDKYDGSTMMASWNHSKLESLRWKYHEEFSTVNFPKTAVRAGMLNLGLNAIFHGPKLVPSIHRTLASCPRNFEKINLYPTKKVAHVPLVAVHYLGSLERYLARADIRRSASLHQQYNINSNFAFGDENHEVEKNKQGYGPWWIQGWLDSFVETHGAEAVLSILGEPFASVSASQ